jgi:hypothetical protein
MVLERFIRLFLDLFGFSQLTNLNRRAIVRRLRTESTILAAVSGFDIHKRTGVNPVIEKSAPHLVCTGK